MKTFGRFQRRLDDDVLVKNIELFQYVPGSCSEQTQRIRS